MANRVAPAVPPMTEREALIACSQIVGRFVPALVSDGNAPLAQELLDAHAAIKAERDRLARTKRWPAVLTELRSFVADYRLPGIDALRQRNGLSESFGAQVIRELS